MKKIISLIAVLFTAIVLTGCSGELDSLEWSQLPKSVYYVEEMTDQQFKESVSIKINGGNPLTLAAALSSNPTDLTFTGVDLGSTGSRTITIKYKSVSIYWAYQVIKGDIPSNEVIPSYDWYDGKSSPYTLSSIEDLYGFANIVNGKDSITADPFAGETVKLAADIDLTGKVWEPIGAAPRMINYLLTIHQSVTDDSEIFAYGSAPETANVLFRQYKEDNTVSLIKVTRKDHSGEVAVYNLSLAPATLTSKIDSYDNNSEVEEPYFICKYLYAVKNADSNTNTIADFKFYHSSEVPEGNFFQGTFDGQGHEIKGLSDVGYTPTVVYTYANSSMIVTGYTFGLFGVVKGNVTVKNLTFEDVQVVGAYYDSTNKELVSAEIDSVGAAIGYACGVGNLTIDNVKVLSGSITAQMSAGGIVGRFYNKGESLIKNSENRANVSLAGDGYHVGGIAGYSANNTKTHFLNNTNYGNIALDSYTINCAGAMINYVNNKTPDVLFDNCRNFGNITGTGQTGLGMVGNIGNHTAQDFVDCVNYGVLQSK